MKKTFIPLKFTLLVLMSITLTAHLQGQQNIDSLLQVRDDANHDTLRVNTNVLIGNALIKKEYDSSLFYHKRAMELGKEILYRLPGLYSETIRQIALADRNVDRDEYAIKLLKGAMILSIKVEFIYMLILLYPDCQQVSKKVNSFNFSRVNTLCLDKSEMK